jgi:hypothetical protein
MSDTAPPTDGEMSDLDREESLGRIDRTLRWAPRDRSRRIRRMEALKARVDARVYRASALEAEAIHKAHRYRLVPFLGRRWKEIAGQRTEERKAAEAEVKWVEYRLHQARQANRRRQEWAKTFAPELAARQTLRAARDRRIGQLGAERLDAARRGEMGPYAEVPRAGSPAERRWIAEAGRTEYRRGVRAERDERRQAERAQRRPTHEQGRPL